MHNLARVDPHSVKQIVGQLDISRPFSPFLHNSTGWTLASQPLQMALIFNGVLLRGPNKSHTICRGQETSRSFEIRHLKYFLVRAVSAQ